MTETLEAPAQVRSAADQLRHCADWLDAHGCDGFYGVCSRTDGQPKVFLGDIAEMKRLFPGAKAKRLDSSRYSYTLITDGIRFEASEWISSRESCELEDVTL